jgi:hypothetical protein
MKQKIALSYTNLRLIVIFVSGLFILAACSGTSQPSTGVTAPNERSFMQALLQAEDFPPGWTKGPGRDREAVGAIGRSVGFHGTDDPSLTWVNVVQQVYLYPDKGSASATYPARVAKEFPEMGEKDSWQPAPHLEFPNHADRMTLACLPVSINGAPVDSCRVVAQYQNMIIIVYGNLTPNRWLTSEDFRNVLMAMDRRASEALTPQK